MGYEVCVLGVLYPILETSEDPLSNTHTNGWEVVQVVFLM